MGRGNGTLCVLLLLLAGPRALAFDCVFVSGKAKDFNDEFKTTFPVVAGHACHVVHGFDDSANGFLAAMASIPAGESVAVIQAAHGNPGGICSCDAGDAPADRILDDLGAAAVAHRITYINLSCFGGDLLVPALLRDFTPGKRSLADTCLYLEGLPNREIYTRRKGPEIMDAWEKGQSVEELFQKLRYGLISSANWGSAGVSTFFHSPTEERAIAAAAALAKRVRRSGNPDAEVLADLFTYPGIGLNSFRSLSRPDYAQAVRAVGVDDFLTSVSDPKLAPFGVQRDRERPEWGRKQRLLADVLAARTFDEYDDYDLNDFPGGAWPDPDFNGGVSLRVPESIANAEPELELTTAAFIVSYELEATREDAPPDPLDVRRRAACRNFKPE